MIFAHGVGSRGDLPLPLWQFAWAAVAALVISFVMVGAAWNRARLADAATGITLTASVGSPGDSGLATSLARVIAAAMRLVGLGVYVVVMAAALVGRNNSAVNIAPVAIYVVLWVGVAVFSALILNPWPWASPFDTITAGVDRLWRRGTRAEAPDWSYWLAPLGALAFLFMELIAPNGAEPRAIGFAMVIYSALALGGAWRWGRDWLARAETFAVLFSLLGAMAPLGVDGDGRLHLRWPLTGLGPLEAPRWFTATALVVLGGTTFDGLSESTMGRDLFAIGSQGARIIALSVTMAVSIALVSALFLWATRSAANVATTDWGQTISAYTPSLVPIVFGYLVAHYAQLLIDEIQTFVFRLSDPFGWGWNLFGTADNTINYTVIGVDAIAWIQALAIVGGHIAAVVVAHDRALETSPPAIASKSQYTMLLVMVTYSIGGLWLLLSA